MIVAIHQPNYLPWFGYFAKIARADVFVFLDDAQYSKNSYINRVQIDGSGNARWLTVPVRYKFGDPINAVRAAGSEWRQEHVRMLESHYRSAPFFSEVFEWLAPLLNSIQDDTIASMNGALVEAVAGHLGLRTRFLRASSMKAADVSGDDRLIALLRTLGSGVTYLSGQGGASYQDPAKFAAQDIQLVYSDFAPVAYPQGREGFIAGLSIVDALFRVGRGRVADILGAAPIAA